MHGCPADTVVAEEDTPMTIETDGNNLDAAVARALSRLLAALEETHHAAHQQQAAPGEPVTV